MNLQIYNTIFGRFLLNENDNISKHLIYGKFWEEELLPIFDSLTSNDVVLEVGSYIGDHTVYLSRKCRKVYAYEGFTRNYYQLCANLLLNDCNNVEAYNAIIGNGTPVRPALIVNNDDFYLDYENNASGARYIYSEGDNITWTLDSLYVEPISLLKIDAEGLDLSILMSGEELIKRDSPLILFEYNELISPPLEDHYDFLTSLGYSCERIGSYNWLAKKC